MTMLQENGATRGANENTRPTTSKRLRIGWQKEFHGKKLLNYLT
jgi:hypothetical protein